MAMKTDPSAYVVTVSGKDFITFPGLLQEAHALGLHKVDTNLINEDLKNPIIKAQVTLLQDGVEKVFTGYGDANEHNVAKKVAGALLRMAETRAVARALRFACNIDMTSLEELDANADEAQPKVPAAPRTSFPRAAAVKTSETVTQVTTTSDGEGNVVTETKEIEIPATPVDTSQVAAKFAAPPVQSPKPRFGRPKVTEPKFPA